MHHNPLKWWRNNEKMFPILACLAKICLPVQPTSAPSERIFSAASMLISSWRTNMDPDFAGKAFFVSSNWEWFEEQVDLAQIELEAADENEGASEI